MALPTLVSSGDVPIETTNDEWTDVLDIGFSTPVNFAVLHNDGDWPGFWRLFDNVTQKSTDPARFAAGEGEPGERRAVITIPMKGFAGGKLQVRRHSPLSGHLSGIYAWAM